MPGKFKIQVLVDTGKQEEWLDLTRSTHSPLYRFDSREQAESVAHMCRPEHPDKVRVVEVP